MLTTALDLFINPKNYTIPTSKTTKQSNANREQRGRLVIKATNLV